MELNPGEEYFEKYEPYISRFNSVKAALDNVIRRLGIGKIYIPYYYCPSTIEVIKKTGIDVRFYHIGIDLMPVELPDENNSIVLLVDYFGIKSEQVNRQAYSFCNAEVIIDRAHGFFNKPIIAEQVHNLYSAKKFFGVPDGAYLVSKVAMQGRVTPTKANGYAGYLLTAYEEGTNAVYEKKRETDMKIAADYNCMSMLSLGLLKNVDYGRVEDQRKINYKQLNEAFNDVNRLDLPKSCAAYQFPLLLPGRGRKIKRKLIAEHIFVSTLWSGIDLTENGNTFELEMMNDAVFLPMDQRYDAEDIEYITGYVKELYRNEDFGYNYP